MIKKMTLPAALAALLITTSMDTWATGEAPAAAVRTSISAVQLYSRQALVSRTGRVRLKPGINRLKIRNLPPGLLDDSVQVSMRDSGIKIQEVRIESIYKKIYKSKEAEKAEKNLRAAQFKLQRLTDQYSNLKEEERSLRNIRLGQLPNRPKGVERKVDPERWKETLDFIGSSLRRNHAAVQALLTRIDRAREELTVAFTVADRYRSTTSISKKTARITLENKGSARNRITFKYRIRGAGWYPAYTARVLTSKGDSASRTSRVRLLGYAMVRNRTGEDWRDVKLDFSAANPSESASLPPLYEWRIKSRTVAVRRRPGGRSSSSPSRADDAPSPASEVAGVSRRSKGDFAKIRRARRSRSIVAAEEKRRYTRGLLDKKKKEYENRVRSRIQRREFRAQTRLNLLNRRSRSYYSKNKRVIREAQAQRRSNLVERNLIEFRANYRRQESNYKRGRFQQALRDSERVLGNIRKLDARHRVLFDQEKVRAERVRATALRFIEQRKIARGLILPVRSSRGYDYRYSAAIKETIRSDGSFHKVQMMNKMLRAGMSFETAPLRRKLAFLTGQVRYRGDSPLLAGPVTVFHNSDFIGAARMGNVSSGERFRLALGNDEGIRITRRTTEFRVKSGVFATTYNFDRTITITARNRKRRAVVLDVYDRIPYSGDDRIKITNVSTSVTPTLKKSGGLYSFRLNLAPGAKKTITIRYRLSHPADILPVFRESGGARW